MITYHRGLLYDNERVISKKHIVYTGKSNYDHGTIKVLVDDKIKTLKIFSPIAYDRVLDQLKEGVEQILLVNDLGLTVLDVWVWWFPNEYTEPLRVHTDVDDEDNRVLLDGRKINHWSSTRAKAIEVAIGHYKERIHFYRERLSNAVDLIGTDAIQPGEV